MEDWKRLTWITTTGRWVYADSETVLLDHFHDVQGHLPVAEEVRFWHPGDSTYLMDSSDLPRRFYGEHTEFELSRGSYCVEDLHHRNGKNLLCLP